MAYLTAQKLGILPEERKALIAFVTKAAKGQIVSLNGRKHYYDQYSPTSTSDNVAHECATVGCVAGYVFAHAKYIQGKRSLRGRKDVSSYISVAWGYGFDSVTGDYVSNCPLLDELYSNGSKRKLSDARRIVKKMLQTGKVKWR